MLTFLKLKKKKMENTSTGFTVNLKTDGAEEYADLFNLSRDRSKELHKILSEILKELIHKSAFGSNTIIEEFLKLAKTQDEAYYLILQAGMKIDELTRRMDKEKKLMQLLIHSL